MDTTSMIGANHQAITDAVLPANPSRDNTAAAVQFGTAAIAPKMAPATLVPLLLVFIIVTKYVKTVNHNPTR